MPVYQVRGDLDVWGNPVDGYEINNQFDKGLLTARADWGDLKFIEALIEAGHLGKHARQMFETEELRLVLEDHHGDLLEVVEHEQAWALQPEGEEPTYLERGYNQQMSAEEVADAEDEGFAPDSYQLVDAWRPVLVLDEQIPEHEERKKPFWRDTVLSGTTDHRLEHRVLSNVELRIDPEAPARARGLKDEPGALLVDVWIDGEFFGTREFPFECGYPRGEALGVAADGGMSVYQPVVYAPSDCKEMEVALDAFWESGGEAPKRYLKVKAYEEIVQGRKNHYPQLISGAYRDGVDDGSVNWDVEYTAEDVRAIRANAQRWAVRHANSEFGFDDDVNPSPDIGANFMAGIRADYPELSEPQFEAIHRRYVDGVISGLTSSALAYSREHGDDLLHDDGDVPDEEHQGKTFIAIPRDARPGMPFNGSAYVLELDDNVLDENGRAVRRWHDAGVEDWEELGVDVDLDAHLEPANFVMPSRGVMTDSRGEFDVYELQDIHLA